jgi:hypothetical protein
MRRALIISAIEAGATGLFLMISPTLFAKLVLGSDISDVGQALGHLGGLVLFSFAIATWPTSEDSPSAPAIRAMLFYNLVATGYLAHLGIAGKLVGVLLWPAVIIHLILTVIVGYEWVKDLPSEGRAL